MLCMQLPAAMQGCCWGRLDSCRTLASHACTEKQGAGQLVQGAGIYALFGDCHATRAAMPLLQMAEQHVGWQGAVGCAQGGTTEAVMGATIVTRDRTTPLRVGQHARWIVIEAAWHLWVAVGATRLGAQQRHSGSSPCVELRRSKK
jgi:hypothetical protein